MGTSLFMGEPPKRDASILDQGFSYSRDHWTSRLPNARQWPTALDDRPALGKWPYLPGPSRCVCAGGRPDA
jgi:hypothetical protein